MNDPALIVVLGEKKAEKMQRYFNSADVVVVAFETAKFFPTRLRAAMVMMPDVAIAGGRRVDQLQAWVNEFVKLRIPEKERDEAIIYG